MIILQIGAACNCCVSLDTAIILALIVLRILSEISGDPIYIEFDLGEVYNKMQNNKTIINKTTFLNE